MEIVGHLLPQKPLYVCDLNHRGCSFICYALASRLASFGDTHWACEPYEHSTDSLFDLYAAHYPIVETRSGSEPR